MRSERSERSWRAASRAPGGGGAPAGAAGGCACEAGARARHPSRQQCAPRNVRGARGWGHRTKQCGVRGSRASPARWASAATVHPRARPVAQRVPPLRGGGPASGAKPIKRCCRRWQRGAWPRDESIGCGRQNTAGLPIWGFAPAPILQLLVVKKLK